MVFQPVGANTGAISVVMHAGAPKVVMQRPCARASATGRNGATAVARPSERRSERRETTESMDTSCAAEDTPSETFTALGRLPPRRPPDLPGRHPRRFADAVPRSSGVRLGADDDWPHAGGAPGAHVPPGAADVFVKLEYFSPTGSYKDRMALAMIEGAETRGVLRPGMRVVEYTGGSTGSSLAMVCAMKGYAFEPLSSDAFAREKLRTMEAFGADLELMPSDGGKVTPGLFDRFKARIAVLKASPTRSGPTSSTTPTRSTAIARSATSCSRSWAPSTRSAARSAPAACWSASRAR